jgi:pilus assembly protein FimV
MENIDLEEGKIRIKGKWLTEDEIRYAIKMKVSSDDYNVGELATALQTLITEMNKSTVLKVRVPKEMADEFQKLSDENDESIESLLRAVIMEYINTQDEYEEEEEEEEYEEIELQPKAKSKRVIVDLQDEDDSDDEDDESIAIEFEEEEDDGLLQLESAKDEPAEFDIEEGVEVEDITEVDTVLEEAEKEPQSDLRKKKATKKKAFMRKKKLRHKKR